VFLVGEAYAEMYRLSFLLYNNVFKEIKSMVTLTIPKIEENLLDVFIEDYNRLPNNMNELINYCKHRNLI
jgi:hypothetical protein